MDTSRNTQVCFLTGGSKWASTASCAAYRTLQFFTNTFLLGTYTYSYHSTILPMLRWAGHSARFVPRTGADPLPAGPSPTAPLGVCSAPLAPASDTRTHTTGGFVFLPAQLGPGWWTTPGEGSAWGGSRLAHLRAGGCWASSGADSSGRLAAATRGDGWECRVPRRA